MLQHYGVNRLSFGVQSFHPEELVMLGRRHSVEQATGAIRMAQEMGFDNVGLDLIFAIPGSTLASWRHSLRAGVELGVVLNVSVYNSGSPSPVYEGKGGAMMSASGEVPVAAGQLVITADANIGYEIK